MHAESITATSNPLDPYNVAACQRIMPTSIRTIPAFTTIKRYARTPAGCDLTFCAFSFGCAKYGQLNTFASHSTYKKNTKIIKRL